ncbi:type IV pilus assembly protein PilM [Clostridium punense]|uniref:Type IV pilus assembly protein PilM n=1 Tax=Clostridium punense TaxID=1054297 RepID=A0ABS4JYU7_9CLOT|nr:MULTISPECIES: type IV pilus assembly protein PilM [Clostridium]EQB87468.1 hypothetical protein M918_08725 [Clostridium sp. BL8]MBP2020713.1 type IV pilus assembly protein PilM [Clostridium punense]
MKVAKLANLKDLLNTDIKTLVKNKTNNNKKTSYFSKKNTVKKLVSLDIGSHSIKVVAGERAKDKIIVHKAFSFPIPEGFVVDGKILNHLEITRLIKEKLALNNVKISAAVCTTNSTSIINRDIVVPIAEESEMGAVINFSIQQYLHINMNDYTIQYDILGEVENEGVQKYKALVITYPNAMSKEYFNLIKECDLEPYALDVAFNSVKKLYNNTQYLNDNFLSKEATTAFVDMGCNTINVHIYKNGYLEFTRVIKSGGSDLDGRISRKYGITFKEAEERKIKYSHLDSYGESEEVHEFNEFLKEELQQWVVEIQRIVQFYKNKNVGNKIDNMYIFGGSSNIKGMDRFLREQLSISVETINTIENIVVQDGKVFEDINIYLNALGALIRL